MPYFSRDGRNLFFTDSAGQGAPLLLLHGLGSQGTDWQPQFDKLQGEFRVLTLDFPGHGNSDICAGPVSMKTLAEDALALLDHLGIARAHVAGLSLGGMVAFQLLASSAERLHSLTVINSGPGMASGRWRLQLVVALRTLLIRGFGLKTLAKRIAPKLFPRADQQPLREKFLQSIAAADEQTYLKILRAIGNFNVWREVAGSPVAVLILTADRDYTPVSYKAAYAATLGNARLSVIENSGHASPMDRPEQCNAQIRAFLREHAKRTEKPLESANYI
ncbi:Pimeloyl-ACP methyl ester carboxylesterase [Microbulbifer donghaiensis]|uniref:Pimeloyl-ACP methyl ester carboxylesterase n=1 Tax=Microbulbifer donghaiensis TaxID=494016 RepID=A0A1M4XMS3_9GAMM|nr:alpha/beta fold hydrolase [Microbulbifer donghaiensis]SHE94720.1 Pimeloyl-ACP methyl ester carboxylesterase [Microbulbifer donghaiensis]